MLNESVVESSCFRLPGSGTFGAALKNAGRRAMSAAACVEVRNVPWRVVHEGRGELSRFGTVFRVAAWPGAHNVVVWAVQEAFSSPCNGRSWLGKLDRLILNRGRVRVDEALSWESPARLRTSRLRCCCQYALGTRHPFSPVHHQHC